LSLSWIRSDLVFSFQVVKEMAESIERHLLVQTLQLSGGLQICAGVAIKLFGITDSPQLLDCYFSTHDAWTSCCHELRRVFSSTCCRAAILRRQGDDGEFRYLISFLHKGLK
jgi:hypothetical protein